MKKYLLGAFLVIVMNLFGAKLSDVKGLEKLKNYNEIKDIQVEKIVNHDITKSVSKKIFSAEDNKFNGVLVKNENNDIVQITFYKDGISALTYFTVQLKIDYQNILVVFCFLTVIANILLIKNNITTYVVESNK